MEEIIKKTCFVLLSILFLTSVAYSDARELIALPDEAVSKKILDNGLTLLARWSSAEGLVAIDVKVKTGSSLEGQYLGSGISHAVEHMIFKGTSRRRPGAIETEVKSYGGVINGSASQDITDFYIILPSKYLPQALDILKDMLLNARMDPAELTKEKEVILKEISMDEDEPQGRIMRMLNEESYLVHPYKYPTIGYRDNLKALTSGDLANYYSARYVPNRIIVTIVGDVDEAYAISEAEKEFRDFRRANYSPYDIVAAEPEQIQPRSIREDIEANLTYLSMGFHSTSILSEDLYAMDVLSAILARGDNSRLNTVLYKNKNLVHTVAAWNYTPRDPGLFVITAILDKNQLEDTKKTIMEEVNRLHSELVQDGELEAAKRMLTADFISTRETIEAQANDISTSYAFTGSETFSVRYLDGMRAITKEDIRSVANKYLLADKLTTVILTPKAQAIPVKPAEKKVSKNIVSKITLPNGIRVIVREDRKIPSVSITAAMLGGTSAETIDNNGISNLTADMVLRGTISRPESAKIKGRIQELGGEMDPFSGVNAFGINITILKPDIDIALEILRDVLGNASFAEREFDKSKSSATASILIEDDDIMEAGVKVLRNELFKGSSYSLNPAGRIASIDSLKIGEVAEFYGKYYVPDNMVIAVSGDVDGEKVKEKVSMLFSGLKWKKAPPTSPVIPVIDKPKTICVTTDKEESLIMLGFRTVPKKDPDRYSLEVLGAVMSGYSGRFFSELRNKLSLAYTLGCWQDFWVDAGMIVFYVATTKDKLNEADCALMDELVKLRAHLITDEELVMAKRELSSRHRMAMQTNGYFAFNFAVEELRGLGYDDVYKYDTAINSVTKEDVKNAANKYLDPQKIVKVVVSSSR